jgi:hypothetical protein
MRYNVNEDYKDFIFTYRTFNIHYGVIFKKIIIFTFQLFIVFL